jgi:hypothetical protein
MPKLRREKVRKRLRLAFDLLEKFAKAESTRISLGQSGNAEQWSRLVNEAIELCDKREYLLQSVTE